MSDAAQGEPSNHEVFQKPFPVKPLCEMVKTPKNYRGFPGGDQLPEETKIWCVQKTKSFSGGVIAFSYGFTDSPDAEILTPGFNNGKESGAVGVGRQGNFLQWGFSAPPSRMTSAGKRFFLNCIHYIRKFDGKPPLVRCNGDDRLNIMRYIPMSNRLLGKKAFFDSVFPAGFYEKYKNDPQGLMKYFQDGYELLYWDSVFHVDEELKSLGIDSNRKVETLQKLIGFLNDGEKSETAKLLLKRYTNEKITAYDRWKEWFDRNRERIYFTDVGGYKFLIVPEGY